MPLDVNEIRPIYDQPGHRHYGPARRCWVILEQLLADKGGVLMFERRMTSYRVVNQMPALHWDQHLGQLIDGGQSEASAQRTIVQQCLVAVEFMS